MFFLLPAISITAPFIKPDKNCRDIEIFIYMTHLQIHAEGFIFS